jgi:lipid-A-disaccharide synthase-like uncharacterized protein
MKRDPTSITQTMRRLALAVAFTVALLPPIAAADIVPPPVPPNLQVPAGNQAFREGHAIGTQNYICLPSDGSVAWTLVGPQATLFTHRFRQVITHFLSPNPDESGTPRATWQHSLDTSAVWAVAIASSSDPGFVAPGAIPWLLLQVVGAQPGPTNGHRLTATTFIQRVHTTGGVAPSTGCVAVTEVGQRAFVPYTADYIFYEAATDK